MKHFLNDLAHIAFAFFVLWLPSLGVTGYVVAGLLIGLLIELKEEDPNVLKVFSEVGLETVNWRDISGYMLGGLIIGIIMEMV